MADLTQIIQTSQQLQEANLILPDVIMARDFAVQKLDIVFYGLMLGGFEEQHFERFINEISEDNEYETMIKSQHKEKV